MAEKEKKMKYESVEKVKELLDEHNLGQLQKRLSASEGKLSEILKKLSAMEAEKAEKEAELARIEAERIAKEEAEKAAKEEASSDALRRFRLHDAVFGICPAVYPVAERCIRKFPGISVLRRAF